MSFRLGSFIAAAAAADAANEKAQAQNGAKAPALHAASPVTSTRMAPALRVTPLPLRACRAYCGARA
jgi:hypothetical protein